MDNKLLLQLEAILKNEPCYEQVKPILAGLIKSDGEVSKRKAKFADSLKPFVATYGKDMMNEFYNYWSECNRAPKPKMRWELEKTWELSKRIARWSRNNTKRTEPEIDLTNY